MAGLSSHLAAGFSPLGKGLAAAIALGGVVVTFVPNARPMLGLVSARAFTRPHTLLTCAFAGELLPVGWAGCSSMLGGSVGAPLAPPALPRLQLYTVMARSRCCWLTHSRTFPAATPAVARLCCGSRLPGSHCGAAARGARAAQVSGCNHCPHLVCHGAPAPAGSCRI